MDNIGHGGSSHQRGGAGVPDRIYGREPRARIARPTPQTTAPVRGRVWAAAARGQGHSTWL